MKSPMNAEIYYYQNSYLLEYNQIYQQQVNSHKE